VQGADVLAQIDFFFMQNLNEILELQGRRTQLGLQLLRM
jgi:hypothetical protein